MSGYQPVRGKLLTLPFMFFLALFIIGLFFIAQRFVGGLGAVANINDGYPWGIWVVVDVVIGSAFGCAGYAVALLVYLFNKGEYHPLVRPALLASLFGYGLAGLAVIIDLGRYWQGYNILLPWYWQTNSVMLEVGLCVGAYILVLIIEFMPAFLERFGALGARKTLNKVLFLFIALGILLPTMHQSSLGTMLVVLGYQISPLWQTQLLPLEYLMTALLMGYALVPFESIMASLGFKRPLETPILARLTNVTVGLLAAYLVVRFGDLIVRGALGYAFDGTLDALMFWIENILFVVPLLLLLSKSGRKRAKIQFIAACLLLAAGSLYRINSYLIGYHPAGGGWNYFPAFGEIMVTVGIFSLEVLLYLIFVKNLPVLHKVQDA